MTALRMVLKSIPLKPDRVTAAIITSKKIRRTETLTPAPSGRRGPGKVCYYRSSDRTLAELWLACARAARPLWLRMLYFVKEAASSAIFASRIWDSDDATATDIVCACEMAN